METARAITLIIVDDHAIVREGIAAFCSSRPDLKIVGQSSDGGEAVDLILLGPLDRHKRAASAQRSVPHAERRVVADRSEARPRDDLDEHAAGAMVLRCKLVARDANRSNLRFRRQRAPLEPVDPDDGAGAGHVLQLLLQCGGVIGQRFDLIPGEHGSERLGPIRRRFLPVQRRQYSQP